MMMNLFSIFDPSIFFMKFFPWMIIILSMLVFYPNIHMKLKMNSMIMIIINFIKKEVKPLLGLYNYKGVLILYLNLFMTLLVINFFSLFPFIFTSTAHISIAFPLSLMVWFSLMLFGWLNNTNSMMAHMVPLGTPLLLMNFMVMIELMSNIIRPITLSIRLTANMVAGHLLLSLLGSFSLLGLMNFSFSMVGMMILTLLELAVSFIQAYVFMTLLTLYSTEVQYE